MTYKDSREVWLYQNSLFFFTLKNTIMKKLLLFLSVVLLVSSCTVSYQGTSYGRVNRKCPTMNQTAFFFEQGTGKQYLPKYVFRKSR